MREKELSPRSGRQTSHTPMIDLGNQKAIPARRLSPVSRAVIDVIAPTLGLTPRPYALAGSAG